MCSAPLDLLRSLDVFGNRPKPPIIKIAGLPAVSLEESEAVAWLGPSAIIAHVPEVKIEGEVTTKAGAANGVAIVAMECVVST